MKTFATEATEASDAALWARVRADDRDAFAVVYRRHWGSIARHLSRRVPHADIEDLLATVFLEAWRQRARLEIRDSRGILPWLYTVSRNVAASHLEHRRRENALARVNATAETMPDLAGVIADDAEREWRIDLARRALASLSEADQEIVDLCITDGLTPAEAASALEISLRTTPRKSRLCWVRSLSRPPQHRWRCASRVCWRHVPHTPLDSGTVTGPCWSSPVPRP